MRTSSEQRMSLRTGSEQRMSLRTSAHTGVALSKDSLRSQSVSPSLPLGEGARGTRADEGKRKGHMPTSSRRYAHRQKLSLRTSSEHRMSLRASAHTGVAIRFPQAFPWGKVPEERGRMRENEKAICPHPSRACVRRASHLPPREGFLPYSCRAATTAEITIFAQCLRQRARRRIS